MCEPLPFEVLLLSVFLLQVPSQHLFTLIHPNSTLLPQPLGGVAFLVHPLPMPGPLASSAFSLHFFPSPTRVAPLHSPPPASTPSCSPPACPLALWGLPGPSGPAP